LGKHQIYRIPWLSAKVDRRWPGIVRNPTSAIGDWIG